MTESTQLTPCLRQLPSSAHEGSFLYPLSPTREILIGRDPNCQVCVDSERFGMVSRLHARVCALPLLESDAPSSGVQRWQITDLNSANGIFVNGERIVGSRILVNGDRFTLGQGGPQFRFESQVELPAAQSAQPPPSPSGAAAYQETVPTPPMPPLLPVVHEKVTLSQLFPIVSTGRDLRHKAYLVPVILTVVCVVGMFIAVGNAAVFNLLLAGYISGAAFYFVYQLCGKHKPWWLLLSVGLMTALLLLSPVLDLFIFIFRGILPGQIPQGNTSGNFLMTLVQMFFGAGLMEELLKALPILLFAVIGTQLRSPQREEVGVWEPLDGILLGSASAVGFTLLETLGQYVPNIISNTTLQAGAEIGQLVGLQLLIPRILGSIGGHMAYSGYFGYFIGLSVLKPSQRWQILGIGYLTASGLHALWNASGIVSFLVLAGVGIVSYAFLAAAILKARTISPTRSQNFATRFGPR
jgi:RsiW-degrading membrane proteinase PrsW (M82 family)